MYDLGRLFFFIDFPCLAACWNREMIGWLAGRLQAMMDGGTLGARHRAAATYSTLTVPSGSSKYNNGAGTSFFRLVHTHTHIISITLLPDGI